MQEHLHMILEEQRRREHMREAEEYRRAKELREARGERSIWQRISERLSPGDKTSTICPRTCCEAASESI